METTQEGSQTPDQEIIKKFTWAAYILFAVSLLTGLTSLFGLILAYLKRKDARGTIYFSHLNWLIKTFWWSVVAFILTAITFFYGIGMIVGIIAGIWYIYRIIKGWIYLVEGKEIA